MMKRILAGTVTLGAAAALAAQASAGTTSTVNISAAATAACSSVGGSTTVTLPSNLTQTGNDQLNTAAIVSTPFAGPTGTTWCNGANANIQVTATPLQNQSTTLETGGFTSHINYTVALAPFTNGVGSTINLTADSTVASPSSVPVGPFVATNLLSGSFTGASASGMLTAGTYQGAVTVTVSPS